MARLLAVGFGSLAKSKHAQEVVRRDLDVGWDRTDQWYEIAAFVPRHRDRGGPSGATEPFDARGSCRLDSGPIRARIAARGDAACFT